MHPEDPQSRLSGENMFYPLVFLDAKGRQNRKKWPFVAILSALL